MERKLKLLTGPAGPVILNLLIFGFISLIIVTPFFISMGLVIIVFLALLMADRKSLLKKVTEICMLRK